ncbi:hypothetical protein HRI_001721500 [Hibiscus trionum]|uniref:PPM-type phosphatase domain-containing protein n=1 Tax=Hibiscus trionum TaxID=183268 RepID=A0A9W7LWM5_HIBTR|nr:hypothetical protein HRI_001721500 [Hibiscus trionum]
MMEPWFPFSLLLISSLIYPRRRSGYSSAKVVFFAWTTCQGCTEFGCLTRSHQDWQCLELLVITALRITVSFRFQKSHKDITNKDQFVVLATDGVWDVVSNEEDVKIVSSTPGKAKAAKHLVEFAACAWKKKRKGIAVDDFICEIKKINVENNKTYIKVGVS